MIANGPTLTCGFVYSREIAVSFGAIFVTAETKCSPFSLTALTGKTISIRSRISVLQKFICFSENMFHQGMFTKNCTGLLLVTYGKQNLRLTYKCSQLNYPATCTNISFSGHFTGLS